jgi:hypothetical protein
METVKSNTTESRRVRIANPLYDYAFKYLMEDNQIARKFISTIIGEEVIELTFSPQECVDDKENLSEKKWTVYRLDFVARIRTNEGIKAVMVEVQKVSLFTDIVRFRRYLGGQYQLQKLERKVIKNGKEVIEYDSIPIYCIFVLGEGIGIKDMPVVRIDTKITNNANNEEFLNALPDESKEFIKNLHHRSWIVQVPELKDRRSNNTEVLLSIFDQTNRVKNDHIFLNVQEENFPEEYRPVIRRLEQAASNNGIRNAMQEEDYLLGHMRMAEIKMYEERAAKEAAIAEKNTAIAEKEAAIAEKEAAIAEKEAAIARERIEKEAAIARERVEKEALLAEIAALKAQSNIGK